MSRLVNKKQSQIGQALILIILVMVVALSLALAVASRSITNIKNATNEEESQKAYAAAEAGIEKALQSGQSSFSGVNLGNNAIIANVSKSAISGNSFLLAGGDTIVKDNGIDVWFVSHNSDNSVNYSSTWTGNFSVVWGEANNCSDPALEVILVLKNTTTGSYSTQEYAYDACSSRSASNNLATPTAGTYQITGSGITKTFHYRSATITVSPPNTAIVARVVPLYSSGSVGLYQASAKLPNQGNIITSTGASGQTQRSINVFQGYPMLPSELFYTLLTPSQQ